MLTKEVIFLVRESDQGGYEARALGHSIFTQGETLEELREMIKDAVRCHFREEEVPHTVELRMETEKAQAVLEYGAFSDLAVLNTRGLKALIEVKAVPQYKVDLDAMADYISNMHKVSAVYRASGDYDLDVLVSGNTMQEIAAFVSEELAPLEGVHGIVTHFYYALVRDQVSTP